MLRQDLNLYKSLQKPVGPTAFLTWNYFWLSIIIITFFFAIHLLYSLWDLHSTKTIALQKKIQSQQLSNELIHLRGQFPAVFFTGDASAAIIKMREELNMQQRLISSVNEKSAFSTHLQSFSKLIVPNVWLTDFVIDSDADTIQLSGKSLNKEDLQKFINNIGSDPDYKKYDINLTNVTNTAKSPDKTDLQFELNMVQRP